MLVRLGLVLSGVVVVVGIVWSVWGYLANRGTDVAGLFAAGAIFFGGIALAVIWLSVFVASVVVKAMRIASDARRS